MGANIALCNYLYYISFDMIMKLHVNEQSICNVYNKSHSDSEQYIQQPVYCDI